MVGEYRERGYVWSEALPDIFEEAGVTLPILTTDQWDAVADALDQHVEVAREFMAPVPDLHEMIEINERPRREADARQIASLEATVRAYNDDIIRVKGGSYTSIDSFGRVVIHD